MCGHAGELAVCFGPNEQEAFNLLCHHAMRNEAQRPLIKAMLELVARHLHYPSLADYVAINIVSFTHYWVGKQNALSQMIQIQVSRSRCMSSRFLCIKYACKAVGTKSS